MVTPGTLNGGECCVLELNRSTASPQSTDVTNFKTRPLFVRISLSYPDASALPALGTRDPRALTVPTMSSLHRDPLTETLSQRPSHRDPLAETQIELKKSRLELDVSKLLNC
uniref:Uncharacterized protein n=1 Tax=Knipowitschia caucasica TaxID=637954 RepID=A0AAV2LFR3_KNICA